MRLIRTTSEEPELASFPEEEIPDYAILSHVWEEEEVSFQHMQDSSGPGPPSLDFKNKKGWSKIVQACKVARSDGWDYIWIDTCCIDKSSSAELSETINSMYRYYRKAAVCYVYLTDLRSDLPGRSFSFSFRRCKWFTRGWTLQELIAPKTVVFFAKDWEKFGTKASLQGILTEITRIPSEVLVSQVDPSESSIAARMSWAAGRRTTRIEDRAYSLMGIFGVYMPPIYGEGEHAFIRLQEEILKVSDDHTLFAWAGGGYSGILATSPDLFHRSGEYKPFRSNSQRPFSMTNMGLLVHLPLLPIVSTVNHSDPDFLAVLNCTSKTSKRLAIYVRLAWPGHQYRRVYSDMLAEDDDIQAKCGEIKGLQELLFKAWELPSFYGSKHFYTAATYISVSLSGGREIVPVMSNSEDSIYNKAHDRVPLANRQVTDTGDCSLGLFPLGSFSPESYAFPFIHDPSQRPFVVMAGKNNGGYWLDLVLDIKTDQPNLNDIEQSYNSGKERSDIPKKNLDRISKFLADNVVILVEGRHKNRGISEYYVNICIVDKVYSDIAPAIPPITSQYDICVSFSSAIKAGFSRLETYPDNVWEKFDSDTMNLFLDDVNTLGTLCFQHEQNQKRFAVTLRLFNSTIQSDVLSLGDTETLYYKKTAKDICDLYKNNQRQMTCFEDCYGLSSDTLRDSLELDLPQYVFVSLDVTRESHSGYKVHDQYKSEVEVEPVKAKLGD